MTVRNAYFVSNFKNTVQVTLRIGREFLQIITVSFVYLPGCGLGNLKHEIGSRAGNLLESSCGFK
jgi:hypothetical protein